MLGFSLPKVASGRRNWLMRQPIDHAPILRARPALVFDHPVLEGLSREGSTIPHCSSWQKPYNIWAATRNDEMSKFFDT